MPNEKSKPTGLGALAQRVILAHTKVKQAEQALEDLKEDLKVAKELMLSAFASNGVTSVKYRGFTVYSQDTIYASLISTPGEEEPKAPAFAALKKNDLGWMVKEGVNNNTLSAWVRELPIDDETGMPMLPAPLAGVIKASKKEDVRIKRS